MNANDIAAEIYKKVEKVSIKNNPNLTVSDKYRHWTIGITDDLKMRKQEHESDGKDVTYWNGWPADSEKVARTVEKYFKDKKMNGGTGGGQNPTYVYIF